MKFEKKVENHKHTYPYFAEYSGFLDEFNGLTILFTKAGTGLVIVSPNRSSYYKVGDFSYDFSESNFTRISGTLTI